MQDLIAKLEAAKSGSRELDSEIRLLIVAGELGKGRGGAEVREEMGHWRLDHCDSNVPHYSTSIDAALTLVPEERLWAIGCRVKVPGFYGIMDNSGVSHVGATPALALCIAALKAQCR